MSVWAKETGLIKIKKDVRVLILGSFHTDYIPNLVKLRDDLIKTGYENTRLVTDFNTPRPNQFDDLTIFSLEKCRFWINRADIFVLVFYKGPDNASVGVEMSDILRVPGNGWRVILAIHERPPTLIEGLGKIHHTAIAYYRVKNEIYELVSGFIQGNIQQLNNYIGNRAIGLWEQYPPK